MTEAETESIAEPENVSPVQAAERIMSVGFFTQSDIVDELEIGKVLDGVDALMSSFHAVKHGTDTYALRNVLHAIPAALEVSRGFQLTQYVQAILGTSAKPVRAIFFDKTEKVNWNLVWHQDLTIALKERIDVQGFGPWSIKADVHHVQPPIEILEQMVAARIHLDDCGIENGALKVLPGTHVHGRLSAEQIERFRTNAKAVTCAARKGDVLFMKPLLLHSSKKAITPAHRRVLHIEFAACELPGGLDWSS